MDDAPMNHVLDASSFPESEFREREAATAKPGRLAALPWDSYVRCLFLFAILGLVGYMAWRPSLLRISILMSMVAPSHGDSLAWQPPPETTHYLQPQKRTPPPSEWRLRATHASAWLLARPDRDFPVWGGGRMSRPSWRRFSYRSWSRQTAPKPGRRRGKEPVAAPPQQPVSPSRGDADSSAASAATDSARETSPMVSIPELTQPVVSDAADAGTEIRTDAPTTAEVEAAEVPAAPIREAAGEEAAFQPVNQPEAPVADATDEIGTTPADAVDVPEAAAPATSPSLSDTLSPAGLPVVDALPTTDPVEPSEPAIEAAAPASPVMETPAAPAVADPGTAEAALSPRPARLDDGSVDWKNTEITAAIPGAYLTIYPKLRFIGLCVPGQGYVRKYNEVAVPGDLLMPKQRADDGRTPYGRYYIAGRSRDGGEPRLYLSWPSPEDARRLGLTPDVTARVDDAWQRHGLPPQDTVAGGGVVISRLPGGAAGTDGGFSLEEPQLEELFIALPDGAWVFVQE